NCGWTPNPTRSRRTTLAAVPTVAAMSATRRDELNSNANPPMPTNEARAAWKYHCVVGEPASTTTGLRPEMNDTIDTVTDAVMITDSAYVSRVMPAVMSNLAKSTSAENSGKPGMTNSAAAT